MSVLQEVTLDFFGCAVKASEFSQHLAAMDLLATQVIALQSEHHIHSCNQLSSAVHAYSASHRLQLVLLQQALLEVLL